MPTPHAATYATRRSRASVLPGLTSVAASSAISSLAKRLPRGALADPSAYLGHDDAWLHRLGEIRAESDFRPALSIVGDRVRRQRDDGDGLRARVLAQDASGLPTVHPRNRDVHQDEVGLDGARELDGPYAVLRFDDLIPEMAQHGAVDDPVVLVVFDEEQGLACRCGVVHGFPFVEDSIPSTAPQSKADARGRARHHQRRTRSSSATFSKRRR